MAANESHSGLNHYADAAYRDLGSSSAEGVAPGIPKKRKQSEMSDAENLYGGEALAEPAASETKRTQTDAPSTEVASDIDHETPQGALDVANPALNASQDEKEEECDTAVNPNGIGSTSAPPSISAMKLAAKSQPSKEFMKNSLTKQNTLAVVSHKNDGKKTNRQMQHRELINKLTGILKGAESKLTSDDFDESLDIINVIEDKFHSETRGKFNNGSFKNPHPQTAEDMYARLRGQEEDKHPWAPSKATFDQIPPLMMRVWDAASQCKIDDDKVGFTSGGYHAILDTDEARRVEMSGHIDWHQRKKTSRISMSDDPERISCHLVPFLLGHRKRDKSLMLADGETISSHVKLALINTHARIAAGKSIVKLTREAKYYGVSGRFSGKPDEYLSPFSIGPDEIIRTFTWVEVEDWMKTTESTFLDWWRHTACLAFEKHEQMRHGAESKRVVDCICGCGYLTRVSREKQCFKPAVLEVAIIWATAHGVKTTKTSDLLIRLTSRHGSEKQHNNICIIKSTWNSGPATCGHNYSTSKNHQAS